MKSLKRIVVGTDFSKSADHALSEALDLAKLTGAQVTLVHSYEIPTYALPDTVMVATAETVNQLADSGRKGLTECEKRTRDRGVPMKTVLRVGPAWTELNAVADEEDADMIVVGTHGRRGLSRALLGSVAERTTRTATRPVLVIHAELEETS